MNRPIKFRAWIPSSKQMSFFSLEEICQGGWYDHPKDWVLMQYTGLIDKNGTPIYEGDWITFNSAKYKYPVEMKGGCWKAGVVTVGHLKRIEIIGNIYENPELIA